MTLAIRAPELFSSQPELLRRLLRGGVERAFSTGDLLMRQGDASTSLFYIVSGRVVVERTTPGVLVPMTLAEIGDGQLVGELGVLDGRPRTANARAAEPTRAVEILADIALDVLTRTPRASRLVMRMLAERLRAADDLTSTA